MTRLFPPLRTLVAPAFATILSTFAATASLPAAAAGYVSSVYASGLNNPRGLTFGPDGLYIAEAGALNPGGPTTPVQGGLGAAGTSGSITRVAGGVQARVVTGLPSLTNAAGEASGPQDIAFLNGIGYVAVGLGANPGVRSGDLGALPAAAGLGSLYTFGSNGTSARVADLARYEASNNPTGDNVDSNPYHVAAVSQGLLVTDAGGNDLLRVTTLGAISTVATFAALANVQAVPTGVAVGPDGAWYVGQLTGFPFVPGSANVYRIDPLTGTRTVYAAGFTNITDLEWGANGSLYVLQFADNGILSGSTGSIQKLEANGTHSLVFGGLVAPTGLAIGNDGNFYVTTFSASPDVGQVLLIAAIPEPSTWATLALGFGLLGLRGVRTRTVRRTR